MLVIEKIIRNNRFSQRQLGESHPLSPLERGIPRGAPPLIPVSRIRLVNLAMGYVGEYRILQETRLTD